MSPRAFTYVPAEPDRRPGSDLIAEWRMHQSLNAQQRSLTPPEAQDRPKIQPVSASHQAGFHSPSRG